MHRFNLCHDLLEEAQATTKRWPCCSSGCATAPRQLDWQRRFNTKPRELAHAQDRLTTRLAGIFRNVEAEG